MRLNKKHIGGIFDCLGGDGSWYYQLVAVRKGELLFNVNGERNRFDICSDKYSDWRPFQDKMVFSKDEIRYGWKVGRRDEL